MSSAPVAVTGVCVRPRPICLDQAR